MGTGHDSGWRGPGTSVLTMVLAFLLLLLAGCWAGGVEAKVVAASVMPHGESWPGGGADVLPRLHQNRPIRKLYLTF